jgi:hypothetical protein
VLACLGGFLVLCKINIEFLGHIERVFFYWEHLEVDWAIDGNRALDLAFLDR